MYVLMKYHKISNRRCLTSECLGLYLTKKGCERDRLNIPADALNYDCYLSCEKMPLMLYAKCYARFFQYWKALRTWQYNRAVKRAETLQHKLEGLESPTAPDK